MAINLQKKQPFNLSKAAAGLNSVFFGLGWEPAKPKSSGLFGAIFGGGGTPKNIDLDASCLAYDSNKNLIGTVWFRDKNARSLNGAVRHSGDNLTGDGDGDDEIIEVDLQQLPANVATLVFTICSFQGQTFNEIEEASVRVVNRATGAELAKFRLTDSSNTTANIMAKLYKVDGEWQIEALGIPANGRTALDLQHVATDYI